MNVFLALVLFGVSSQQTSAATVQDKAAVANTAKRVHTVTKSVSNQKQTTHKPRQAVPKKPAAGKVTKVRFSKRRTQSYTFEKLVRLAERHAYEIKASESCINEARNCYILGQFNYMFPDVTVQATINRSARVRKDTMEFVWEGPYDTPSSHRSYYNRELTLEASYQLSKLYDLSQQSELHARYITTLCDRLNKGCSCRQQLLFLVRNIRRQSKRIARLKKAVEKLTIARIAVEDKLEAGEVCNEAQSYNELTLGQIATKQSDARERYFRALTLHYAYKKELELLVNRYIPPEQLEQMKLPVIKKVPKVSDVMLRNSRLMQSYAALASANARNSRQKLHTFAPNIKAFARSQFSYEEYGYLYLYLPVRLAVGVNLEHRISMDQVIQISSSKFELSKARSDYCEQYKNAYKEARDQVQKISSYITMLDSYETTVEENEKDALRYEEKSDQDPYNYMLAQQYSDTIIRWVDSEEKLEKYIMDYAEFYFAVMTPLPRNLRDVKLPSPRSTLETLTA